MASITTPSAASNSDVMTGYAIACETLKETVSEDHALSFTSTTMEDVWGTVTDIERNWMNPGKTVRICPFLIRIEGLSKFVEVFCGKTPYLPYLWVSDLFS